MRTVLTLAVAFGIGLYALAADKTEPVGFSKGPSTAQLKAKNVEGENWEGPHVAEIKSFADWDKAFSASKDAPLLVFKHSTECPVNAKAAYRVNQWLDKEGDDAPKMMFVKVIESRPVSLKIAADVVVKHESPQVLLLKDGKAVWNTSHDAITAESLEKALDEFASDDDGASE